MTAKNSMPTMLLLIFITLKLCGVIHWSWWWVLSPFWIPCVFAVLAVMAYGAASLFETPQQKKLRNLSAALRAYAKKVRG